MAWGRFGVSDEAMLKWRRDHRVDRVRGNALGPFGPEAASKAAQVPRSRLRVQDLLNRLMLQDGRLGRQGVEMFPQLRSEMSTTCQ